MDFCDSHTVQHIEVSFLSSCLHLLSAKCYIHENSTFELSCICITGRGGFAVMFVTVAERLKNVITGGYCFIISIVDIHAGPCQKVEAYM